MNTIVVGSIAVLAFYVVQISLVGWWLGWGVAILYGASLPMSATWDFRYADRLRRAAVRIRTYFRFRRDPSTHQVLRDDLVWLRSEALALDALIATAPNQESGRAHDSLD